MQATVLAGLGLLTGAVLAQNNMSDYDYSTNANPQLDSRTLATIPLGFPDCNEGPLAGKTVCNSSASAWERASSLISMFTLEELINNTANTAPGVPRLGIPPYEVWNEALHGLSHYFEADNGTFSWTTAFPQPILSMASMNRSLIHQIGDIISTQARAASNAGRYGLDVYSPNINGFRSPVWGRGQETPGEDAFFLSSLYAYEYITAMQGGVGPAVPKMASVVKHFAGYDIESWHNHSRLGNNLNITNQALAGYFTPQFKAAVQYAKAKGLMCAYNAVNGESACADPFFLQNLLREEWGFTGFVSSDCGAIYSIFNPHMDASNRTAAAALGIRAGTDIDCGTEYSYYLTPAVNAALVDRDDIEKALTRLYSVLVEAGYFDGNSSMYRDLTWDDVLRTDALNISYEAAVEGQTLLKNDGTLPLMSDHHHGKAPKSVALIGPYANATTQLLGDYAPTPPYITSLLDAFEESQWDVNYAFGTGILQTNTTGFDEALQAARNSDVVIFAGGIDLTVEDEALDRESLAWPGNQLELIDKLSQLGKPVVVLQFGGGQVDDSALKANDNVNSILWCGYPGQSGGQAILDVISGKRAPAGRLVTTQYPAEYINQFDQLDTNLMPHGDNPGQTYMWYTDEPVYAFGHGLFYTTFEEQLGMNASSSETHNITEVFAQAHEEYEFIEQTPLLSLQIKVTNTGDMTSDYSAMLFASTTGGPEPRPKKWLVGIDREATIAPGDSCTVTFDIPIGVLARANEAGDLTVYPGEYELALNNERSVVYRLTLTGNAVAVAKWPLALADGATGNMD
ncbi:putative exo-1,4-beta-xylosidase xlnD [Salinomyces thailandicus]|uniref:xylan 1,4-beta-xylosidase n=1 Tax=Salinomyces thailandicus TaxID=706561 RepID=A0A4U0TXR8_9PEZI|nr:putative exo-1,4-beta-xylosidase xlnD [Salinomyces thailandica]